MYLNKGSPVADRTCIMAIYHSQYTDMSQAGSRTTINPDTSLIIMDCFETVVCLYQRKYVKRNGIARFLQHFKGQRKAIVIHSDAKRELVIKALQEAQVLNEFDAIYDADNAGELLDDETPLKCLNIPMRDFECTPANTIFIGDSPMDAISAGNHDVPFIRVPRSEDLGFSFVQLIKGPSRYSSEVFSDHFDDFYKG